METKPVSPAGASTDSLENVTRSVARDGTSHVVTLERDFANPPENIWGLCTTPEGLARWFEPAEGELRQGGRYRLTDSGTSGTIERCEANALMHLTWEYDGDVSRVSLALEPAGHGTRLTLRHVVADNEHWAQYGPAATGIGWDGALLALAIALADEDADVHATMSAFNDSDGGRRFVASAADRWCIAHLSAGADPDDAHESATRTAAFYTGDE
ncbi:MULTISPECIES: SRPBCC domain-containing protein [unclassified Pseudoclavibacter]|uniref:SRPBCC domain-containing protein n=1 Tax=unclassified Pseudoclavibacter TaxID=2615177 RepID=UPI000CE886F4|nr:MULTISPECIES: SRPBCC domain-containing protein [unclassified Pseudoclavibacter]MBF4550639.1 SRPBCC domain-containing protein [Pseudoclavibacter sp. VKM Ac-2888]PPF35275.1 ATPase [Pseudoclavibacter sp. AY1H1]PPF78059.1 ATPase [Pseudoclavibacter sp. Z016]